MISSQHWDDLAQIIPVVGTSRHAVWGFRRAQPARSAGPEDDGGGKNHSGAGAPRPRRRAGGGNFFAVADILAGAPHRPTRLAPEPRAGRSFGPESSQPLT